MGVVGAFGSYKSGGRDTEIRQTSGHVDMLT